MKRIIISGILMLMTVSVMVVLSGCNADEPITVEETVEKVATKSENPEHPNQSNSGGEYMQCIQPQDLISGEIDAEFAKKLSDGRESRIYERDEKFHFFKLKGFDGLWDTCTGGSDGFDWLMIDQGYVHYLYFARLGYHPRINVIFPWKVYQKATNDYRDILLRDKFVFSDEENGFVIDRHESRVEDLDWNGMTLSIMSEGVNSQDEPIDFLYILNYSAKHVPYRFQDGVIVFDSEREILSYVIEKLRETFGEQTDANEYFAPNVIFDHPYLNIDELEREYASYLDHKDKYGW